MAILPVVIKGDTNNKKPSKLDSKGAGRPRSSYFNKRVKRQLDAPVTPGLPATNINGGPNVADQNFNKLRGKGNTASTDIRFVVGFIFISGHSRGTKYFLKNGNPSEKKFFLVYRALRISKYNTFRSTQSHTHN